VAVISVLAVLFLLIGLALVRSARLNRPQLTQAQLQLPAASSWEARPARQLFPATLATEAGVTWDRVGISPPASCAAALASSYASGSSPCRTVLRATYVDQARSMAATVAIVVAPPSSGDAIGLYTAFSQAAANYPATPMPVQVTPVPGTAAATWQDAERIGLAAGGLISARNNVAEYYYALIVETGSLNGRPARSLPGPWGSQPGGDQHDRDGWQAPADALDQYLTSYLKGVL